MMTTTKKKSIINKVLQFITPSFLKNVHDFDHKPQRTEVDIQPGHACSSISSAKENADGGSTELTTTRLAILKKLEQFALRQENEYDSRKRVHSKMEEAPISSKKSRSGNDFTCVHHHQLPSPGVTFNPLLAATIPRRSTKPRKEKTVLRSQFLKPDDNEDKKLLSSNTSVLGTKYCGNAYEWTTQRSPKLSMKRTQMTARAFQIDESGTRLGNSSAELMLQLDDKAESFLKTTHLTLQRKPRLSFIPYMPPTLHKLNIRSKRETRFKPYSVRPGEMNDDDSNLNDIPDLPAVHMPDLENIPEFSFANGLDIAGLKRSGHSIRNQINFPENDGDAIDEAGHKPDEDVIPDDEESEIPEINTNPASASIASTTSSPVEETDGSANTTAEEEISTTSSSTSSSSASSATAPDLEIDPNPMSVVTPVSEYFDSSTPSTEITPNDQESPASPSSAVVDPQETGTSNNLPVASLSCAPNVSDPSSVVTTVAQASEEKVPVISTVKEQAPIFPAQGFVFGADPLPLPSKSSSATTTNPPPQTQSQSSTDRKTAKPIRRRIKQFIP